MLKNIFFIILFLTFFPEIAYSHTYTGMNGFYDGLSHPVIGLDHFLAMVSVGIISAQLGGRSIWSIPSTFVVNMLIGGVLGIYLPVIDHKLIEYGIIVSVILLGLGIAISKKLSALITMIFVVIFAFCHGIAHGLEIPNASNPLYFALGFSTGTAILHLFGVGIGYYSVKTNLTSILLRVTGFIFSIYGVYLVFSI